MSIATPRKVAPLEDEGRMTIHFARTLSRAAAVLTFALVSLPALTAEVPPVEAAAPSELTVSFDAASYEISIRARNAPLVEILEQTSSQVGFMLSVMDGSEIQLDERTSVDIEAAPVDQALHRLLEPFNKIVLYEGRGRVSELFVVSRRTRGASGEDEAPRGRPETEPGDAKPKGPAEIPLAGEEPEDEEAVEPERSTEELMAALWSPDPGTFREALEALLELDPALAVSELERQLDFQPASQAPGELVAVRRLRVRAARALGAVGGDRAVELLIRAFDGMDPAVREAAAKSLARIGNDRALRFLSAVVKDSDPERKRTAITAIAFVGRPEARSALAEGLDRGEITPEAVPEGPGDEAGAAPLPNPGSSCLGSKWSYPSCSHE
jgi:hypothetical protein